MFYVGIFTCIKRWNNKHNQILFFNEPIYLLTQTAETQIVESMKRNVCLHKIRYV